MAAKSVELHASKRLLPPIPKPPHDPTWWLLDSRVGWQAAVLDGVEVHPSEEMLMLAPNAEAMPPLADESGSFGGVTLPSNVALAPDGSVYLLDREAGTLKRFDPCTCMFERVPCFGGTGPGPRELNDPRGIGIRGDRLFVCDAGNHRLGVFALPEMVLQAHWSPPASAGLAQEWTPHAVAFDRRGRVFVTDPANGYVHRFHPLGVWEDGYAGFGLAFAIAVNCEDHVHVATEKDDPVRVIDIAGHPMGTVSRLEEIQNRFPRLPFIIDRHNRLHLAVLCPCPPRAKPGRVVVFDLAGNAIEVDEEEIRPRFEREGLYVSRALDGERYQCAWHRIVLQGEIPDGTSVRISTHTSHALQPEAHLLAMAESSWTEIAPATGVGETGWDGLIRSGAGRYLWLRMHFRGNGKATPRLRSIKVEHPRISLRRYLPAVFGEEPVAADFADRFLSVFDTTLRSIEHQIDTQARLFDPLSAPATKDAKSGTDFLSWLATWIGVTLERHESEERRRQALKEAARFFALRGTRYGLWQQLLAHLGMEPAARCCPGDRPKHRCRPEPERCAPEAEPAECTWQAPPLILEHYQLRRWLFVGSGRLGDQAVLWGRSIVGRSQLDENAQVGGTRLITSQDPLRDPFHVYAHRFSVFVPAAIKQSPQRRRGLENLINTAKPAHTQAQIVYVEPRFRIGVQSMIGLDAVVGCYPTGVTLGESPLGTASVLTGRPKTQGVRVGQEARIGTTTL